MRLNAFFRKNCWLLCCFFHQYSLVGQVAVELEKMNVVMAGIDNPMSVVVNDLPDSCLMLRPSMGNIQQYDTRGSHYMWHGYLDSTLLTIMLIDTCHHEIVGQRIYRVKELPVNFALGGNPRNNKHRRAMGVAEFKEQGGISAQIEGYDICGNYEMVSFEAQFFSKQTGGTWSGFNTGARFKGEMLEHQQAVQPGDWVMFNSFSYRYPGKKQPIISDEELYFKIK